MVTAAWDLVKLLAVDIDGTLTNGFIYWAGPQVGWTQRYSVRDGEALVRLRRHAFLIVPISRNTSACAKARMESLSLPTTWVGVTDKEAALKAVCTTYALTPADVCYVGDGREDVAILSQVGLPCSVADGHAGARAVAHYVTAAPGGLGAVEEISEKIMLARGWLT